MRGREGRVELDQMEDDVVSARVATRPVVTWIGAKEVPVWRDPEPIQEGVAGSSTDRPGVGNEDRDLGPAYGFMDDTWELGPGYVMVRHYRARRKLFVPPANGEATLGPDRFRNERQTHIEYERVDGSTGRVKITDNWREVGEADPGYGWWRGTTFLTFQGQSLAWDSSSYYTNTTSTDPDDDSEPNDDGNTDELSMIEVMANVDQASEESGSSRERRAGGYRAPNGAAARAAENYITTVDGVGGGSPDDWRVVRRAGDELLRVAGSVTKAAESLWESRERMGRNNLAGVDNPRLDTILHPDVLAYLRSVRFNGMRARFTGPRQRVKACLHPNAKKNLGQVYSQLWKDVRKQRALVVDRDHPQDFAPLSRHPFEAVDKLLPDRTISPDKRVVHDQRGVNYYTDKTWHPPAAQPSHAQVARRILLWKVRAPGLPVLLAKKDVAGAFRLLWVAPSDVELFAGDLPWSPTAMGEDAEDAAGEGKDLTIIYLVSSFGFSGSPGEWAIWGRSTEEFHRCHRPEESRRDGSYGFESKILVDDNVLIEPWMGLRPWVSSETYEEAVRLMLGESAVNAEKDKEEGDFRTQQTIYRNGGCSRVRTCWQRIAWTLAEETSR